MATLNAPTLANTQYSGVAPLAAAHGKITLAAAAINDKVRLLKVAAGSKFHHTRLINAALGASVTMDLGFEYVNGEAGGSATQWFSVLACSSAAATVSSSIPVTMLYDAYIIATVKGAIATGALDVIGFFEPMGI